MDGSQRLIAAVQELSLARDLERITQIVRQAAREMTGADGATFVLRDGDLSHYVAEDAIEPLWEGQRFPLEQCISGWSMLNRQAAVIEDIYADPRIPADAYRPTFVKSLVMVPIRSAEPVGAIGNYWASHYVATAHEVALLAALADSTSIAMENVQLYQTLEKRVEERTAQLAASQAELAAKHEALIQLQRQKEDLAALLMHDLKSPAGGIMLACRVQLRKPQLTESDRRYWKNIFAGAEAINRLASNLIDVTRAEQDGLIAHMTAFDLNGLLEETYEIMSPLALARDQQVELQHAPDNTTLTADRELLRRVLQNLIDNALRFNAGPLPVRVGVKCQNDSVELRVIDTGPGVPEASRQTVFDKYARLAASGDPDISPGHGLGLTFCRMAVEQHGGSIWIEPNQPHGSVFVLRLPLERQSNSVRG
jgi:signal transduction histidine kinase